MYAHLSQNDASRALSVFSLRLLTVGFRFAAHLSISSSQKEKAAPFRVTADTP